MRLEEQIINLAVLAERIEVEFGQRGEPVGIELLEARPPPRRNLDRVRSGQAAAIRDVALDQAPQLARRSVEVLQVWRVRGGVRRFLPALQIRARLRGKDQAPAQ